jgi:energy-coupling factor transporter transmembrane protein EcfT
MTSYESERKWTSLDPRSKMAATVTVSSVLLAGHTGSGGIVLEVGLSLVPLVLLFFCRRFSAAGKFAGLLTAAWVLRFVILPETGGVCAFFLLGLCGIATRLVPGLALADYLLSTTTVSEFIAAMERMHVSQSITIPFAVMMRLFPVIGGEVRYIHDAMKLRGISFGSCGLLKMIEYRLIPLVISVVRLGDELSAASLSRGLGAPGGRTNVCSIGMRAADWMLLVCCVGVVTAGFL